MWDDLVLTLSCNKESAKPLLNISLFGCDALCVPRRSLITCVHSCLPPRLQAWWITDSMSTDLWGSWEMANSVWLYTNLKNYPEGKTLTSVSVNQIGDLRAVCHKNIRMYLYLVPKIVLKFEQCLTLHRFTSVILLFILAFSLLDFK